MSTGRELLKAFLLYLDLTPSRFFFSSSSSSYLFFKGGVIVSAFDCECICVQSTEGT